MSEDVVSWIDFSKLSSRWMSDKSLRWVVLIPSTVRRVLAKKILSVCLSRLFVEVKRTLKPDFAWKSFHTGLRGWGVPIWVWISIRPLPGSEKGHQKLFFPEKSFPVAFRSVGPVYERELCAVPMEAVHITHPLMWVPLKSEVKTDKNWPSDWQNTETFAKSKFDYAVAADCKMELT